jgi:hypothetical protein
MEKKENEFELSSGLPDLRYKKTFEFFKKFASQSDKILDLGTPNPFSELMIRKGYSVQNTKGEDFDPEFARIATYDFDCLTSFEVFEHLMAPYNLLNAIQPKEGREIKLITSVPLSVWFSKAYWNKNIEWDRHYHEFEPRQFDWLLEKTGWEILHKETWKSPDRLRFGIRPVLRFLFPGYYFVHAVKRVKSI